MGVLFDTRSMKRLLAITLIWCFATASAEPPHWRVEQAARLADWLDRAPSDGLAPVAAEAPVVRAAITAKDPARIDHLATAAAVRLLQAHRTGCCHASARSGWHIAGDQAQPALEVAVATAVANDDIDGLFEQARPSHPYYRALRDAYAHEQDPGRRATLAANLDRWRWMPRALGTRYLLVNAAAFEATLWDKGTEVGRWEIIIGKTRSPTPVFAAKVTGVILNPWWDIPSSIVAESVGAFMRRSPTDAARKGYVIQGGQYRQRPGPGNALGRMKLVMPNGYHVYLHDTPAQSLFDKDVRAFSHGCVRVGDALGLATALLSARSGWNRARTDAMVEAGQTVTVPLPEPVPVYVAYFTAEPDGLGGIRYFPDIYRRDAVSSAPGDEATCPR